MKLNLERLKSRLAEVVVDELRQATKPIVQVVKAGRAAQRGSDVFSQIDAALQGFLGEDVEEEIPDAGFVDVDATEIPNP